ncbi:glycosyl hydrolase family 28-related protein [Puia sp. P3]|uniref:glycosyl hydrolase family 28-related protein n=1 Tax=Puia sp. P3 TaxID=3423952 RepID=UPI003D6700C2
MKDYGAVADCKTNNTRAIQKAIDQANSRGGATVLVPPGRWVTGVLTLRFQRTPVPVFRRSPAGQHPPAGLWYRRRRTADKSRRAKPYRHRRRGYHRRTGRSPARGPVPADPGGENCRQRMANP